MIRKLSIIFIALIAFMNLAFATPSLSCQFKPEGCNPEEAAVLYANENFFDASGEVLSSNVAISDVANYHMTLCCYSPYGELSVRHVDKTDTCGESEVDFMYFTDENNARLGIEKNETVLNPYFNYDHYTKKSCIKLPSDFGSAKLISANRDYSPLGYSCLFKTNSLVNGVISACNATFNSGSQYQYTVWGQIFESTNTLNCNADCVSTTTKRIYSKCSQKLDECHIPNIMKCDGALLGTWVHFNNTHEIKCQREFDEFRPKVFTEVPLNVSSTEGHCQNIISKKYSVLLNNEMVNLRVFVCED